MHPAKLFPGKMAQPGYIIGTLTSFSSLSEWYSKGVKFSPTLENIDESPRVLAAECPTDHKKPRAPKTSPSTRKELLERKSLYSLKKKTLKISYSQEHSHQTCLDPLDHQVLTYII